LVGVEQCQRVLAAAVAQLAGIDTSAWAFEIHNARVSVIMALPVTLCATSFSGSRCDWRLASAHLGSKPACGGCCT
jgi:hypothetical protein